jgi:hypothetical protein
MIFLFSTLLALFWCARVSSFSILAQFVKVDYGFSTCGIHQKDRVSYFVKRSEKKWGRL